MRYGLTHTECGCAIHKIAFQANVETLTKALWADHSAGRAFSHDYFREISALYISALDQELLPRVQSVDFNKPDHLMRAMMHSNIFQFSAGKTSTLMALINNEVKESTSFSEFERRVQLHTNEYNRTWLNTEYVTARQTGINSARYLEQQEVADVLPYLQYRTQRDGRVRNEHSALDGMTFPVHHPIWQTLYPPNGWKCRCFTVSAAEPAPGVLQNESDAMKLLGDKELERMRKSGFANTPLRKSQVYDPSQFYATKKELSHVVGPKNGLKNYGLKPAAELSGFPPLSPPNWTEQHAAAWFESKVGLNALSNPLKIRLRGFDNLPITLDRSTLLTKSSGKYADRAKYVSYIEEVIQNPDEVYYNQPQEVVDVTFMKFYEGRPLMVYGAMDANEFRIKSWYPVDIDPDSKRHGVLIKQSGRTR